MNIYLDIDGVLLANDENLALHAEEFVKNIVEEYGASTYWLTTHCMHGDPQWAVQYVCRAGGESIRSHLEKIQPTTWSLMKTEAIDFSEPFIWFDDDLFHAERIVLEEHEALESWREVDLKKYPHQLRDELNSI